MRSVVFRKAKLYPLTSVRFFGACWVVFHHTALVFLPGFSRGVFRGTSKSYLEVLLFSLPVAVSFFFLLSGYVLARVYLRDGERLDWRRFFAARFARIYPLFFLTLVLDTPYLLRDRVHRNGLEAGLAKTAVVFLAHTAMLHAWCMTRLRGIDDPNWSLAAEAFFYVCFPFLGVVLWRLKGVGLGMTALGLYLGGQILVVSLRQYPLMGVTVPVVHLSTFALGVLLARWQTLQGADPDAAPVHDWQVYCVLGVAGAAMLVTAAVACRYFILDLLFTGLLVPIFAGVIWALSSTTTFVSRVLCAEWLIALGNASFALYLIHTPLLHLFESLGWQTRPVLYPVYLALCVGLSVLSFYYFETPARMWLLSYFHSRSAETLEEVSSVP